MKILAGEMIRAENGRSYIDVFIFLLLLMHAFKISSYQKTDTIKVFYGGNRVERGRAKTVG